MPDTTQKKAVGFRTRCPLCDGTKAMFLYRKMDMYGGREVRLYAGSCTLCDADGYVNFLPDSKQLAGHEVQA